MNQQDPFFRGLFPNKNDLFSRFNATIASKKKEQDKYDRVQKNSKKLKNKIM